jgi:hypothetical protein
MPRKGTGDDNPHSELMFERGEAEEKKVTWNRGRENFSRFKRFQEC